MNSTATPGDVLEAPAAQTAALWSNLVEPLLDAGLALGFLEILGLGLSVLAMVSLLLITQALLRRIKRLEGQLATLAQRQAPAGMATHTAAAPRAAAPPAQASAPAAAAGDDRFAQLARALKDATPQQGVQQASRLLQAGADPAEVASACGLSRTEVDLLARLGGSARRSTFGVAA